MRHSRTLTLALVLLAAPLVRAQDKVAVEGSDLQFDATKTETIGGQSVELMLTGTALREKAWVNVYALGSYVQQGASAKTAEELAAADVPKQLHLIMERGVGGKKMASAFQEGIEANYPASEFSAELGAIEKYFTEGEFSVEKGDHLSFTHEPGKGMWVKAGKKEPIQIQNAKFSKAFWDIYFGKNNIGSDIKKSLVSRLK